MDLFADDWSRTRYLLTFVIQPSQYSHSCFSRTVRMVTALFPSSVFLSLAFLLTHGNLTLSSASRQSPCSVPLKNILVSTARAPVCDHVPPLILPCALHFDVQPSNVCMYVDMNGCVFIIHQSQMLIHGAHVLITDFESIPHTVLNRFYINN